MITTLTGSNGFALKAELNKLLKQFVAEHGDLALEKIDAEEAEYDRIRESLESLPFLVAKKLVVLRSPSANKEFTEKFESLLAEIPESTDLIIVEPKLDKRSSFYKFLQKHTDYRDFPELDVNGLANDLVNRAKERGGTISRGDAQYLVERVGANQNLLINELNKLLAYDPQITRATINLLTEETPQSTIFQLLDAAFAGNRKQTLKLYKEQRTLKVEPQQIIAMLAWQLHVLAIVKTAGNKNEADIAREARLNPFVVRKTKALVSKRSLTEIKKLVSDLAELDSKLKTITLDADEAVQVYLLAI